MLFQTFKTRRASNAAAIKIALDTPLGATNATTESAFITALSEVLQVLTSRIYILSDKVTLSGQKTSYQSTVMKQRQYIYEVMIAPNK